MGVQGIECGACCLYCVHGGCAMGVQWVCNGCAMGVRGAKCGLCAMAVQ